MAFKIKQKEEHYKKVAKKEIPVKKTSKFAEEEQIAYARGQVDARMEQKRIYAYKNATPEQRKAYRDEQLIKRAEWLKSKKNKK